MNDFVLASKEDIQYKVCFLISTLKEYNLTQTQIGILLEVTDRTIRNWENGSSFPNGIQLYNLWMLCKKVEGHK